MSCETFPITKYRLMMSPCHILYVIDICVKRKCLHKTMI